MIIDLAGNGGEKEYSIKTKNNCHIFLIIVSLALLGCSETTTKVEVPTIEAKVVGKGVDLVGIPYLLISVTNMGRTEANIVHVDVYVQKNENIVDAIEIISRVVTF